MSLGSPELAAVARAYGSAAAVAALMLAVVYPRLAAVFVGAFVAGCAVRGLLQ